MIRLLTLALAAIIAALPAQAQKLDDVPRTVVMTAIAPEWDALVGSLEGAREHRINGNIFLTGTLAGKPVVLMRSGLSMVNAAMNTQLVLDRFTVKRILFSGIAGGVDPALAIGDVLVAADWGQYLEAAFARRKGKRWQPPQTLTPGGPANWYFIFPHGTIVGNASTAPQRLYRLPVDPALLAVAQQVLPAITLERCVAASAGMREGSALCLPHTPRIHVGGTGVSAGVYADNAEFRRYLHKAWAARVLDMESAAVVQVAFSNSVPAIIFRSVSDLAGGDPDRNRLATFGHLAAVNSAHVVRAYLAALAD
ncbi:5'-methylthioadenosine/S-adenosylhomocysteine nucleosidase [Sandarakinorhabdus oryzae]|uniref:5'-methylthioadenosine/S-adenosylhomocysteine nucleosidase n=1 Tax=Sandarakinorhabdus oryzae TaxID=2675220 RepID=UPI0012E2506E|nr:5'-methylthioadenosine/S-adenosylhomocysteine nucleosidase [Sandarakinorhabdus oryzae]